MKPIKDLIKEKHIVSSKEMTVELTSNLYAIINNCNKVLEYNARAIVLEGNKKSVTFIGDNLELRNLAPTSAVVAGKIMAMEFDDRGGTNDH